MTLAEDFLPDLSSFNSSAVDHSSLAHPPVEAKLLDDDKTEMADIRRDLREIQQRQKEQQVRIASVERQLVGVVVAVGAQVWALLRHYTIPATR